MKINNKFNLPQTFVNVLKRPSYDKGRANLSVTQLINSPKIVALSQKFQDELEEDVADRVWSIFGSAVHQVLEHGKDPNHVVEERLHTEIEGWNVSGAIDLQIKDEDGIKIRDYKVTSAWAAMNEKIEWEQQLNTYAFLVERVKQVKVKDLGVVAIIRDWSRREAAKRDDYPSAPIKELPIKLWTHEERESFVLGRIAQHSACEFALESGEPLPECTPEEMWEKPTSWAIKKKGNVRAKAVLFALEEAQSLLDSLGNDFELEMRPGERTRCANFCPVSNFCQQWRDHQGGMSGSK